MKLRKVMICSDEQRYFVVAQVTFFVAPWVTSR